MSEEGTRAPAEEPGTGVSWTWQPFPEEAYRETLQDFVHYSAKLGNSKVPAQGIRLGPQDGLDWPLVCGRVAVEYGYNVPADYTSSTGQIARIAKQVNAYLDGRAAPPSTHEAKAIDRAVEAMRASAQEIGLTALDLRQVQLLLPCAREAGGYLAITPLGSAGFSQLLRVLTRDYNARARDAGRRTVRHARLPIGGTNSQNLGNLVFHAQQPLVFTGPTLDRDVRVALAIYHDGPSLTPSLTLMRNYRNWRARTRRAHGGTLPARVALREQEAALVAKIARDIHARAAAQHALLLRYRAVLPGGGDPLVNPALPLVQRGLLDPRERAHRWAEETGAAIAQRIADFDFRDGGAGFDFAPPARATLADWATEALR